MPAIVLNVCFDKAMLFHQPIRITLKRVESRFVNTLQMIISVQKLNTNQKQDYAMG